MLYLAMKLGIWAYGAPCGWCGILLDAGVTLVASLVFAVAAAAMMRS